MRYNSTVIKFDNQTPRQYLDSLGSSYTGKIFFGTTEKDMYKEELSGSRNLISEKIPGRDQPYFYKVDHEVLEFNMILAFEERIKEADIKRIINWLYRDDYKKLEFGARDVPWEEEVTEFQSRFFNVIFTNKPVVRYVSLTDEDTGEDYIEGYIKLHARCNSSTGFEKEEISISNDTSFTLENTDGAMPLIYNLQLVGNDSEVNINDISIGTIAEDEVVNIKNDTKTIESSEDNNIYDQWEPREFLVIEKGETLDVTITGIKDTTTDGDSDSQITIYRPVYL